MNRSLILLVAVVLTGCSGTHVRVDDFGDGRASVTVNGDEAGIVVGASETGGGIELLMLGSDRRLLVKNARQFRGIVRPSSANLELLGRQGQIYQLCLTDSQLSMRCAGEKMSRALADWPAGETLVIDWGSSD